MAKGIIHVSGFQDCSDMVDQGITLDSVDVFILKHEPSDETEADVFRRDFCTALADFTDAEVMDEITGFVYKGEK